MVSSVLSDKVEIKKSMIDGQGLFANEKIYKGEIVCIKGGYILKREQIFSSGVINSYHPISDEYYLAADTKEEEENIKIHINHSCNPNCGLRGEITFVAIRDIEQNEELTIDYAFLDNEEYQFKCNCGSERCRKIITGTDWKIKGIQEQFYDYFASYLKEKIRNISNNVEYVSK